MNEPVSNPVKRPTVNVESKVPPNLTSEYVITWKIKLFIVVIIGIIFTCVYYFYIKAPLKNSDPSIPENLPPLNLKPGSPSTYLFSKTSNKLYMKDISGEYWDAGLAGDCIVLSSSPSTTVIADVYGTYNIDTLPPKYKNSAGCTNLNPDGSDYCRVLLQTADDYEKFIVKNIKGKYVPSAVSCSGAGSGSNGAGVGSDFGKMLLASMKNIFMGPLEFLNEHKDELIQLASTVGEIVAVTRILSNFAAGRMLAPLVAPAFIMMQAVINGNTQGIEEAAVQSGFFAFKAGVDKFLEKTAAEGGEDAGLSLASSTSEELITATVEEAASAATEIATTMAAAVAPVLVAIELVMVAGMILDMLDLCGFNKGYLDQSTLDTLKDSYSKLLYNSTNGTSYPILWNAVNNCEYQLDDLKYWYNCMTPDEQAKNPQSTYCKDYSDKINQYSKEYLNSLKVNSQGQCLKSVSNIELQRYLQEIAPQFTWDEIGALTNAKIKKITLPTNNTLKKMDLLFTNKNVIVASYVDHYWYLVVLFMILVLIIMVFL